MLEMFRMFIWFSLQGAGSGYNTIFKSQREQKVGRMVLFGLKWSVRYIRLLTYMIHLPETLISFSRKLLICQIVSQIYNQAPDEVDILGLRVYIRTRSSTYYLNRKDIPNRANKNTRSGWRVVQWHNSEDFTKERRGVMSLGSKLRCH